MARGKDPISLQEMNFSHEARRGEADGGGEVHPWLGAAGLSLARRRRAPSCPCPQVGRRGGFVGPDQR